MRKVIERMNAGMIEEQRKSHQPGGAGTSAAGAAASGSGGTKKWIGGAIRRVTGGGTATSPSTDKGPASPEADDDDGMKVDWYLVVFLKFLSSIVPTIELDSTSSV
jgi:ubiquitin-like-conjugating enzyme ATG3